MLDHSKATEWIVLTGLVMNVLGGVIYTYVKHWEGAGRIRRTSLENGANSQELLSKRSSSRQHSLILYEDEDKNRTI